MPLDRLAAFDPEPDPGSVVSEELAVTDDVLVKAFALGPDGQIPSHEHADATNVFHVLQGTVTVERGDTGGCKFVKIFATPGVPNYVSLLQPPV